MPLTHRFLKNVRALHLYLGVFTAPALVFFAITGGLQSFGLHEAGRDSHYKPPAWLVSASQLHKKQTLVIPQRHRPPAIERAGQGRGSVSDSAAPTPPTLARDESPGPKRTVQNLWPMKVFFGLVALSLIVSVLSGVYMAWRFSRRPVLVSVVLTAGLVVPLLLLLF